MTETTIGSGVELVDVMPKIENPDPTPPVEMPTVTTDEPVAPMPMYGRPVDIPNVDLPEGIDLEGLIQTLRASVRHEMDAAVADVERRHAQAREMELAALTGAPRESFHTEDLSLSRPMIDGYVMTANSPVAGSIAWSSVHIVLLGVDYTIADGNTANKYAWFVKPGTGTTATMQTGNTLPTLGPNDCLVFVNNGGVPVSALDTSISYAVAPGVIGQAQLDSTVATILSTLQSNDIAMQSQLDGAITTYYQNDPPWPSGSPSPSGGNVNMGDVWYDANDNGAYRWTGSGGTPANTWSKIADTDTSALAGKVAVKTTTYLANNATPPTAPTGGHTTGDLWMVLDQNNLLRRWSGSAWVDLQLGDAAISGIGGAKVGSGINATNITTGTLTGSRVGAGVAPTVLTGAGTAPVAAIPTLGPAKLNTAFHMIY